jgi:hypothetical protein
VGPGAGKIMLRGNPDVRFLKGEPRPLRRPGFDAG